MGPTAEGGAADGAKIMTLRARTPEATITPVLVRTPSTSTVPECQAVAAETSELNHGASPCSGEYSHVQSQHPSWYHAPQPISH